MIGAPALAFVLLAAGNYRGSWRDALQRGFVLFAVIVGISTELLSAFSALTNIAIFVLWCLVSIAAAGVVYRRRHVLRWPGYRRRPIDWLIWGAVALVVIVTAIIALRSPPNSADAMAYHLPRVIYWAQQRNVSFFPTSYLNQISLQPTAEYLMLHGYLLAGDQFANLGQWLGSVVSIVGVSLIAENFGAAARGQAIAALFCATIPIGILQSTGAKNDYLMAAFLVCFVYFTQKAEPELGAIALGLALMTKATAYLFAPGLLFVIFLQGQRRVRLAVACAIAVIILNGPQFWRNYELSGSPLGYDSAQADGRFRWANDRFGFRQTLSNILRNTSEQLGSPADRWNQGVYRTVLAAHRIIGIDPNDPATTWTWEHFQPPRNANHEANAPARWQLLLLMLSLAGLLIARPRSPILLYAGGLVIGFVLFCAFLKWQPFMARMFLPLLVLSSPVAGVALERVRWEAMQILVCLFLMSNARLPLLENWVRPLRGPNNIFRAGRNDQYFADLKQFDNRPEIEAAAAAAGASGCSNIGIDTNKFQVEYPLIALVRQRNPQAHFLHVRVNNPSSKFAAAGAPAPCAVVCLGCGDRYFTSGLPK